MTATWNDVQANPDYQKLTPEQKEAARNQYFDQVVAPKVPKDQLTAVRGAFDKDTLKAAPKEQQSLASKAGELAYKGTVDYNPAVAAAETGLQMATGAAALPVAAGASLYQLATAPPGEKAKRATEASQGVQEAMTYQPRTEGGKGLSGVVGTVLGIPGQIGDYAQEKVGEALEGKVSVGTEEAARATARMIPEALVAVAGGRAGDVTKRAATAAKASVSAAKTAAAATRTLDLAKDFVANKVKMKWEDVPEGLQKKLRLVARDPQELAKLDPETVQREARAERLNLPITRGQASRNVAQLTKEETLSKADSTNPVRQIHADQDERLHELVDEVHKSTGATATTRQQIGKSIQDEALRPKVTESVRNYNALYKKARETEPDAAVSPKALFDLLKESPELHNLNFMEGWLKKAKLKVESGEPGGAALKNVKLKDLDDLRKKANGIAKKGGDNAYYAGEVVKAIDQAFEKVPAAAKAWKEARDAFKAHKREFEDQGVIKALATDKKGGMDRATGLSQTTDKILSKDAEDIAKVHKSLTQGGTPATRAAGEKAWKNFQAGVLDYLRESASGKRGIVGERGQPEFNAAFRDKFAELDKDGKIDLIFDKAQAKRLRDIYEAVGDVRTKPSKRISGSDTAANLAADSTANTLSKLEKVAVVPKIGAPIAGVAKVAGKVMKLGQNTRDLARARTSPITEAAQKAKSSRKKSDKSTARKKNTLKALRRAESASRAGPLLPLTLREREEQSP